MSRHLDALIRPLLTVRGVLHLDQRRHPRALGDGQHLLVEQSKQLDVGAGAGSELLHRRAGLGIVHVVADEQGDGGVLDVDSATVGDGDAADGVLVVVLEQDREHRAEGGLADLDLRFGHRWRGCCRARCGPTRFGLRARGGRLSFRLATIVALRRRGAPAPIELRDYVHQLPVAAVLGQHSGRVTIGIFGIRVGAHVQEADGEFEVLMCHRLHQRGPAVDVAHVGVGAVVEEQVGHVWPACLHGGEERGLCRGEVGVGALLQQPHDDVWVAGVRRYDDGPSSRVAIRVAERSARTSSMGR